MYEKHYGMSMKPFQTVPNPDIFYLSPKHENALTYLEYGIMEKAGFVLLTGEVGSGKTTLIRYLLNKIESDMETAVIFNTNVTAEQLVEMILNEFEVEVKEHGKARHLDALFKYLIDMFGRGKRVLLIIDEAQNLDREALEEVRMLSNLQTDDQGLLQIMLVGQPELGSKLMSPELAQLNQRITVAYHIPALSREEAGEYISYRLEKSGGRKDLFTTEAVDFVFKSSGGIPRTINIICDTALVYGFSDGLQEIDAGIVRQVLEDREGMGLGHKEGRTHTRKSIEGE
jgi:general secretion pathway protein A